MANKFAHIKSDTTARGSHCCNWYGCKVQIPRSHLMCEQHWLRVPKGWRDLIWGLYELGQEDDPALVSENYQQVVKRIHEYTRTAELVSDRPLSQPR